jgi:hypothetical protein
MRRRVQHPLFAFPLNVSGSEQTVRFLPNKIVWFHLRGSKFWTSEGWTIEDEQWQEIGGGYEAVKFRFLLFL